MKSQRCKAKISDGTRQCRRWAIVGSTVCPAHGASAPQVRAAAGERIRALVHPAIDAMERAIASNDPNPAVRAAKDLLDRAGYGPPKTIEIEDRRRDPSDDWPAWCSADEAQQLIALHGAAVARRDAGEKPFASADGMVRLLAPGELWPRPEQPIVLLPDNGRSRASRRDADAEEDNPPADRMLL